MPIIHVNTTSRKEQIVLVIIAYIFNFMNLLLMSTVVFLFYRTSEEYMRLFPLEYIELKYITLLVLLCPMSILTTGFILHVYVYILDST